MFCVRSKISKRKYVFFVSKFYKFIFIGFFVVDRVLKGDNWICGVVIVVLVVVEGVFFGDFFMVIIRGSLFEWIFNGGRDVCFFVDFCNGWNE